MFTVPVVSMWQYWRLKERDFKKMDEKIFTRTDVLNVVHNRYLIRSDTIIIRYYNNKCSAYLISGKTLWFYISYETYIWRKKNIYSLRRCPLCTVHIIFWVLTDQNPRGKWIRYMHCRKYIQMWKYKAIFLFVNLFV